MLHALRSLATGAAIERATLVVNHVLSSEAAAAQRLRGHAGQSLLVRCVGWPSAWPALPDAVFRITSAGLLECCGEQPPSDVALQIDIDAANPAYAALLALGGERPQFSVSGDAALAGDVNWLIDNVRWDIVDDLEAVFGPSVAYWLGRAGAALGHALRGAAQAVVGANRESPPPPPNEPDRTVRP